MSWTLGTFVEHLLLTGSSVVNGTGNGLGNTLTGNGSADSLAGGGGSDRLLRGGGADRLSGGDGADSLNGGAGGDLLTGGTGRDSLTGPLGDDAFQFLALAEVGDVVTDFRNLAGDNDRIVIEAQAFGGRLSATGPLAQSRFQIANDNRLSGTAEAGIRFIWGADDTRLWFDRDGSGSAGPPLVADLQAGAELGLSNIFLI